MPAADRVLTTTELCKIMNVAVTAEDLTNMGAPTAPKPEGKKRGTWFYVKDINTIMRLLGQQLVDRSQTYDYDDEEV